MIYAKRVRSPLKGGVDVELGPKTVLVGPNGAGKTAVLQALKLGTRGYVDDQEGKDGVATTAAIARLFPEGADLKSEVDMSDGKHFEWASKPRGKGYTKPKVTSKERPYPVSYPFQDAKTLMSGDQKKIRSWLEQKAGGALSDEDLMDLLPPAQKEEGKKALAHLNERSPVELANSLKAEARNLRAGATRKEKTIDSLVEGIPLPLSDSEAETLRERKAELWAQATAPDIVSPEQHEALRQSIVKLVEVLTDIESRIEELPPEEEGSEETADLATKGHALAKAHLEQLGHDVCYVCLRKDADIQSAFNRWAGVLTQLEGTSSRVRLQAQYEKGKAEAEGLAARYKAAKVVDSGPVTEEHSAVSSRLSAHDNNKRLWRQSEGLRMEVASDRSVADTYTSLARTWGDSGHALLLQRKTDFEAKVSKWLPEGEQFAVDLEAGRIGLLCGDVIHTSLSGAEMARVLLAVLSAERDESSSTPSILEPDDRGWDPDTLASVMTALTDSPDQVILMSTVVPARTPEGWRIIEV
jgi:hypothetical protein